MAPQQLPGTPWRLLRAAAHWPVDSQQRSRRNALVATTALTERRRERIDVEDFLATLTARDVRPATTRPTRTHSA